MTAPPERGESTPEPSGRILAVDDNRLNRLTLERTLQHEGHEVQLAESGERALELLEREEYDVVLLDILMPGMDGYTVLERMKRDPTLRDLPVIVISALDDIESAVRCIEMGAEDYLPKPFNAVLLRARLNASLQRKKLRDMEKAYLEQEVTLRQNERLAMLGKLSAGMAHELNNPAAAAQRGAQQLAAALDDLERAFRAVGSLPANPDRDEAIQRVTRVAVNSDESRHGIDAVTHSDLVAAIEDALEDAGVEDAWEIAPDLVDVGYREEDVADLIEAVEPSELPPILAWLAASATSRRLLDEIVTGSGRIAELVRAMKSYTYLDQAPLQEVDVHEGLESTLVILRSKMRQGVRVHRDYAEDLPRIPAYGSELNQVWTNLLDNAVDAMNGEGDLYLGTRYDASWVIVSVEDTGAGIPEHVLPRVFDPFFTTKPPGSGTGLGLNISHAIIAEKHDGRIEVQSAPGQTRFEVWLPRERDISPRATGIPGAAAAPSVAEGG